MGVSYGSKCTDLDLHCRTLPSSTFFGTPTASERELVMCSYGQQRADSMDMISTPTEFCAEISVTVSFESRSP